MKKEINVHELDKQLQRKIHIAEPNETYEVMEFFIKDLPLIKLWFSAHEQEDCLYTTKKEGTYIVKKNSYSIAHEDYIAREGDYILRNIETGDFKVKEHKEYHKHFRKVESKIERVIP